MSTTDPTYEPIVPMHQWGSDHWEMLIQLRHNEQRDGKLPRRFMRTGQHNALCGGDGGCISKHPTRLKRGVRSNHDDWDCVSDFVDLGLAYYCTGKTAQGFEEPRCFLTTAGGALVDGLLTHMEKGNHSSTYTNVLFTNTTNTNALAKLTAKKGITLDEKQVQSIVRAIEAGSKD